MLHTNYFSVKFIEFYLIYLQLHYYKGSYIVIVLSCCINNIISKLFGCIEIIKKKPLIRVLILKINGALLIIGYWNTFIKFIKY